MVVAAGLLARALTQAVHDNLRNLGLDVLDVVNLRIMFDAHGPAEGSIEAPLTVAGRAAAAGPGAPRRTQQRHAKQIEKGARIAEIVCVQNHTTSRIGTTMR